MGSVKKRLLVATFVIISGAVNFVFADDDIFESIDKSLKEPVSVESRQSYPVSLVNAIGDKKSYILYKEVYASTRYSTQVEKFEGRNSLGFILFGTFSGPDGQIGDLNVQFRTAYYNDQFDYGIKMTRDWLSNLDQFAVELHNAYLRLRVLPPMLNVRVGHFYVPYGLQPWIDTHGTLLQGPSMRFIGDERDWGVAIEGQNDKLEYELGLTRGSGMRYFNKDDNYAVAGKISTPRIDQRINEWLGASFLIGRIYDTVGRERLRSWTMEEKDTLFKESVVKKWRIGIDGQGETGPCRTRFEITGGQDAAKEAVLGEFFELKYALGKGGRWNAYFQFENLTQDFTKQNRASDMTVRTGLTYGISANYNIQFVVSRDLSRTFGVEDTWIGVMFYGQKGGGLFEW
ncbi:MAG: hypothetical protein Q7S30_04510 [Candidatus Omnitrophota bacterium]|nr:hypothetical protein [Candidatus Omnitrophota bacterium]